MPESINRIRHPSISPYTRNDHNSSISALNANAAAIIKTGNTYLGVNDHGELNVSESVGTFGDVNPRGSVVGLTWGGLGDATSPGCLCEGWGAGANGIGASANRNFGAPVNLTLDSFTATTSTATSVTHLTSLPDLKITHNFKPSAATNIFEVEVTLANVGGSVLNDVRYTRAMDWDIPTHEFSEYVTIGGTATTTNLLFSSDDGFAYTDPYATRSDLGGCGVTTDFTDCGPDDHGALFDFGFGDLAAGESLTFSIFYGAEENESAALASLGVIGAEIYSFGQDQDDPSGGTPATFIFAFKGVGGTVIVPPPTTVPEPSTLALLGLAFAGLGLRKRKH